MRPAKRGRRTVRGVELVKLGSGRYVTVDGRFLVERDENTGSKAWWLDDRTATGPEMVASLTDAVREIAARRSGSGSTPPVGADTPPVPAGGVVPGLETSPEEVNPPAAPPEPTGGFTPSEMQARSLHPSCPSCPSARSYRQVAEQIADDTILLVTANTPETLGVFRDRVQELVMCGDPRRLVGVVSSLATIARSSIETPHPLAPDLTEVMVTWRSRLEAVYGAAAQFFDRGGDR